MPKATGLPALNLSAAKENGIASVQTSNATSPPSTSSPRTPRSIPGSPLPQSPIPQSSLQQVVLVKESDNNEPASPGITAMPDFPPSPRKESPKHGREASKSFFSNLMASKSSHKLQSEPSIAEIQIPEKGSARSRASSKDRSLYSIKKQGSTPDLPRLANGGPRSGNEDIPSIHLQASNEDVINQPVRKGKSKFGNILSRTKTVKHEDDPKPMKDRRPSRLNLDTKVSQDSGNGQIDEPLKTAPIRSDYREQTFGDNAGSTLRNRSADRHITEENRQLRKERQGSTMQLSSSLKESSLLSTVGRGVGDRFGRAGRSFFGKITRSASSNERELVTDDTYICTTINMPLIRQTRKTRIAKRLETSRDKTEFWMPALPWRCIDYLNMNGCEEEGLYRIPGSGRDVKHWQRRFDTELDIDLFNEPELRDINTIGSMFKSWLRELPDEIFPKATQNKIATQCAGATECPQLLKDELSKLPPFNYYLIFAITCHLSLLHSYADKNKMDYRNLCICFQPCLKIDGFCFQFLVMDWKACWQGCWTEKEFLEEEYRWEKEGSVNENETDDHPIIDDRAVSSSGSSQHQTQAQAQGVPPRTADSAKEQRKSTAVRPKQRSLSSGASTRKASTGHTTAQSMPTVPRLVKTPEPPVTSVATETKLPEVGGLSPIRM